jgi:sporulation protein YlmC with PRC-barrel domain
MKTFLTTASVVALMAGPAIAQNTTMPKTTTVPAEQQQVAPAKAADAGDISATDLLNKSVKNASNETVGDINDLSIDASGKIASVIVGVGGFLGMGEKDVALPYDQLSFTRDANGKLLVTAKVSKASLQSAPEWKKPKDRS